MLIRISPLPRYDCRPPVIDELRGRDIGGLVYFNFRRFVEAIDESRRVSFSKFRTKGVSFTEIIF